ncbi:MAG: RpiB/LacA/LacB family sugar-phosphate isomerase [Bacteroidales bacterium]|nr:RpiB/LacA/LacB family sugar-phosphate isomerase [Bacteroidales bacterium]
MKIGICNDHAGTDYKFRLVKFLEAKGIAVVNFGTDTTDSMDYPDVAHPLAEAVLAGKVDLGIALCGTGNGMALCLNHHAGIRAGLAWNEEVGRLVKAHNNANVLVMPARFIPYEEAEKIVDKWLSEPFEGGRHQRRVEKIEP